MDTESQNSMQLSGTESLLTSSQYAKVIFHDVPERYSSDQNLLCQYTLLASDFQTRFGDRIALFKLGWHSITDYELFEWATVSPTSTKNTVTFTACNLPKEPGEFYQFCYINADNAICGASVPFQFSVVEIPNSNSLELSNRMSTSIAPPTHTCDSCLKLQKQNHFLEKTISHVNETLDKYDGELGDLRKEVNTLKLFLKGTQNDISDFKTRLEMAGEEFKKLYLEKKRVERKYDKLVKKCLESKKTTLDGEESLGELAPLPAFPLPLPAL